MLRLQLGFAYAALLAGLLSGCVKPAPAPARVEPETARIDAQADEALRKMSAALSAANAFSFRGTATMEEPLASGTLATFSRETRVVVRRPDRVFAESKRSDDTWLLWYASTSLTILNKSANAYATVQVPARIDEMLDHVATKYDLTMPLADLLFADVYKVLTAHILTGSHVGQDEVNGTKCTHLLFTQKNVDWQIWIRADGPAIPVKLVIDYKNRPGSPQFAATLSDWNLSATPGEDQFKPVLPENVKRVEMAELLKSEQQKK